MPRFITQSNTDKTILKAGEALLAGAAILTTDPQSAYYMIRGAAEALELAQTLRKVSTQS